MQSCSGHQGSSDRLQSRVQAVLILSHDASCTGDDNALSHIKLQRPKHLSGVVDVDSEDLGIGIPLDKGQGQRFPGILLLEAWRKSRCEEWVEPVDKDFSLSTHLAHEDWHAQNESLGLPNRAVDARHVVLDDAAAVFGLARKTGVAGLKVKPVRAPGAHPGTEITGSFEDGAYYPGCAAQRTGTGGKSNDVGGVLSQCCAPLVVSVDFAWTLMYALAGDPLAPAFGDAGRTMPRAWLTCTRRPTEHIALRSDRRFSRLRQGYID